MTAHVNMDTGQVQYVCLDCLSSDKEYDDMDIDEVNKALAEVEDQLKLLEQLAKEHDFGEMEDVPMAFTPKKMYRMALDVNKGLKLRKLELESKMPVEKVLEKELQQAVEKEDFEKAASIKKKLEERKAQQNKTEK